ncbi:MSHA biogenesis protein MshN [Vibrio rotiferianus]|uniref:tetratricopeptide repeat protein n=1 Tax=Vibrio rotiferianus TaxID=190895 RepID=UPI002894FF1C|nr:MSHA biogenesis protein MshN [Vibrio rotiferianus]
MEPILSAINKALSELAEKEHKPELSRAEVPVVAKRKPWLWLIAGFSMSLAIGGWAVSQAPTPDNVNEVALAGADIVAKKVANVDASSPTTKTTPQLQQVVAKKNIEVAHVRAKQSELIAAEETHLSQPLSSTPKKVVVEDVQSKAEPATLSNEPQEVVDEDSSMHIEQVELSHQQLATKAMNRAGKAMDSNDMQEAMAAYAEALRYEPSNIEARQKLAALYFGKSDTRKAYEILQAGIKLDNDNQPLRLALSKLLVKANQPEAALSPLVFMPDNPTRDYLAMRAALAQKQKQTEFALESYQLLTQREPENARWWLGLAIQQERKVQIKAAVYSYQQALGKVGVSNQSQAFIRDRLSILKQLEGAE